MRRSIAILLLCAPVALNASPSSMPADIAAFNRAFADATKAMSDDATLALWDDDGVSLLPGAEPIVGKAAIAKFIHGVTAKFGPATMERFNLDCHDAVVSGDWASEWCTEEQSVRFESGRPRFEGSGKMLLVLHRKGGVWRLKTEMWNQGVAAGPAK